jgi:hypothetical protein
MYIERAQPPRKVDLLLRRQVTLTLSRLEQPAHDCFLAAATL